MAQAPRMRSTSLFPRFRATDFRESRRSPTGTPSQTAQAWAVLMQRLGYTRYVAQGGDLGSVVTTLMGKQAPPGLLAINTSLPATVPLAIAKSLNCGDPAPAGLSADEAHAYAQLQLLYGKQFAYAAIQHTRPQTLYGIADSPVGLAAWLLDHGDGWNQPAAAVISAVAGHTVDGHSAGALTRDDVLDNITLYWLTNTGVSAARSYWLNKTSPFNAANISIPTAAIVFPGRDLPSAAQLDEARVSQPHLLQPRERRRPLCGVGTAASLFRKKFAQAFDRFARPHDRARVCWPRADRAAHRRQSRRRNSSSTRRLRIRSRPGAS